MEQSKGVNKILILILVLLVIVAGVVYYYFRVLNNTEGVTTPLASDKNRQLVTIAIGGDIAGFYPESEDESYTFAVNRHIFEPLVVLDKRMTVKAGLAEKWTNPDPLTWRFYLRKNVKFQDGSSFTADDVKYSIDEGMKNEWSSINYLTSVASVTVVDPTTVDIKTTEANPVMLNQLANVLILSKNYVKGSNPNGTGPYKYTDYIANDHITLDANTAYYGGEPKVKKVIFKVFDTEDAAVKALIAKTVDLVNYGIEENASKEIKANNFLTVKTVESVAVSMLILNNENAGLKDKRVREALYRAINIENVISKVMSGGEPATQAVQKVIFGYNPDIKRLSYDPEKSKALLKEAGFENLALTLDDAKGAEAVDQEIVNQLNAAGFKVTLNIMERDALYEKLFKTRKLDMFRTTYSADTGDAGEALGSIFHSPDEAGIYGMVNYGYVNAALDKLVEQASTLSDQTERKTALQQAMKLATDDIASIPLYTTNLIYGVDKTLKWEPRPDRMIFAFEMSGK